MMRRTLVPDNRVRSVRILMWVAIVAPAAWLSVTTGMAQGPGGRGGAAVAPAPAAQVATLRPLVTATEPTRSCPSLRDVSLPNVTVELAAEEAAAAAAAPALCRVTAVVTHPPSNDRVRVFLAFPMQRWNGRFQGVGGGGFSGGNINGVRAPAIAGYAAGSTDTGHEGGSGSFALDREQPAELDAHPRQRLPGHPRNDGRRARRWRRPSTGRHPRNPTSTDARPAAARASARRNGILPTTTAFSSGAPAINWTKLHVEQLWGHTVCARATRSCRRASSPRRRRRPWRPAT